MYVNFIGVNSGEQGCMMVMMPADCGVSFTLTDANHGESSKQNQIIGDIARSESRHSAPLAASSRSFHGDGETRVSAVTRTERL